MSLAVLAGGLALGACDTVPLLAPTESTITVSASARSVALGGAVEVSAVLLEQAGTVVQDGTQVRFTTTLGSIAPANALTVGVVATATLSAGSVSGVASVRAVSGAATGTSVGGGAVTNTVEILIGAAAADSLTITANPSGVPSGGGTVSISATVLDASGNGLPGLSVVFSTTAGTLTEISAISDVGGRATVGLVTTEEATVTATIGSAASTSSASVTVSVAVPGTVTLRCQGSGSIASTNCSQILESSVAFTVERVTAAGASAIANATLEFGDGFTQGFGSLSSSRTVTHVYGAAGTYTALVRATDVNGEQTEASVAVTILAKRPFGVTVAASATSVTANLTSVTFTATLTGDTTVNIASYDWTFLDSTGGTERSVTTSGNTVGHVFTATGNKTIRVVATAADGRTVTGETQINVQ